MVRRFLSAVVELVHQTCVPIIMTCQRESKILIAFSTQILYDSCLSDKPSMMDGIGLRELTWRSPDWKEAVLYLHLIAAVEGSDQGWKEIQHTYSFLDFDFRRTLMHLQLSSVNPTRDHSMNTNNLNSNFEHAESNLLPRTLAAATGFSRFSEFNSVSNFGGKPFTISLKEGMARTHRVFDEGDTFLDVLFQTERYKGESLEIGKTSKGKAELDKLEEMCQIADAMSCASYLSQV